MVVEVFDRSNTIVFFLFAILLVIFFEFMKFFIFNGIVVGRGDIKW